MSDHPNAPLTGHLELDELADLLAGRRQPPRAPRAVRPLPRPAGAARAGTAVRDRRARRAPAAHGSSGPRTAAGCGPAPAPGDRPAAAPQQSMDQAGHGRVRDRSGSSAGLRWRRRPQWGRQEREREHSRLGREPGHDADQQHGRCLPQGREAACPELPALLSGTAAARELSAPQDPGPAVLVGQGRGQASSCWSHRGRSARVAAHHRRSCGVHHGTHRPRGHEPPAGGRLRHLRGPAGGGRRPGGQHG